MLFRNLQNHVYCSIKNNESCKLGNTFPDFKRIFLCDKCFNVYNGCENQGKIAALLYIELITYPKQL